MLLSGPSWPLVVAANLACLDVRFPCGMFLRKTTEIDFRAWNLTPIFRCLPSKCPPCVRAFRGFIVVARHHCGPNAVCFASSVQAPRQLLFGSLISENQTCTDLRAAISRDILPPLFWSPTGKTVDSCRRICRSSRTSPEKQGVFPVPENGEFPFRKRRAKATQTVTTIWCMFGFLWTEAPGNRRVFVVEWSLKDQQNSPPTPNPNPHPKNFAKSCLLALRLFFHRKQRRWPRSPKCGKSSLH